VDAGLSLNDIEHTVLPQIGDGDEHRAALWLYACAYRTTRPTIEDLADRLTRRPQLLRRPARRRRAVYRRYIADAQTEPIVAVAGIPAAGASAATPTPSV
jgi:hypothetical protein